MAEVLRVRTKSEAETKKTARLFAKELLKVKPKEAIVVGLEGELGAGKTVFAKGFARGLGIKEEVKSPSFILMRAFSIPATRKRFFHFDAFRIKRSKEFLAFGFRELLKNPLNILLIEWSDRIKKILPKTYFKFTLRHCGKTEREIILYR